MKSITVAVVATLFLCCGGSFVTASQETVPDHVATAVEDTPPSSLPLSLSLAYAGENLIHSGAFVSLNAIPTKRGTHELLISGTTGFFVFRPFCVSLLYGARAQYKINLPFGLALRVASFGVSYKHKVMLAEVYEVTGGEVRAIRDPGYGNVHMLVTTGLEYDFADPTDLPFATFADFGISAEPYFGVFRFHLELYVGLTYHLTEE